MTIPRHHACTHVATHAPHVFLADSHGSSFVLDMTRGGGGGRPLREPAEALLLRAFPLALEGRGGLAGAAVPAAAAEDDETGDAGLLRLPELLLLLLVPLSPVTLTVGLALLPSFELPSLESNAAAVGGLLTKTEGLVSPRNTAENFPLPPGLTLKLRELCEHSETLVAVRARLKNPLLAVPELLLGTLPPQLELALVRGEQPARSSGVPGAPGSGCLSSSSA